MGRLECLQELLSDFERLLKFVIIRMADGRTANQILSKNEPMDI